MAQEMQPYEKKLASALLKIAAEHFGNHICNDFLVEAFLTPEECQVLTKQYHEWNGDPEEYREDMPMTQDYALMGFLADRIYTDGL